MDNVAVTPGTGATIATDDVGGIQFQKVKIDAGADGVSAPVSASAPLPCMLRNSAGTAIASLALGTTLEGLLTAAGATDFFFSTANATTVQLAAAATFTGTVESIISAQAWSIILTSDQPGTLTLNEYIDAGGARTTSTKTVLIAAGVPFSRCYTANGNYFRLTFQNTGGGATTTLNINTAFGVLPAVTNLGNGPVSLEEIAGTAIAANAGATNAGTQRIIRADGQVQDVFVTGQGAQSASGNNILLAAAGATSVDAIGATGQSSFRSFTTQIVGGAGIASGQVIFEGSNDNATFVPLSVYDDSLVTAVPIVAALSIAASTNRYFSGKTPFRYIRCRISTVFAGGTIQAFTRWSSAEYVPRVGTVAQPTAANLNANVSGTVTSNLGTGGTGATSLGKAEDAVAASGDTCVAILGVRRDALVTSSSATGDYNEVATNRFGAKLAADFRTTARTFRASMQVALAALATDIMDLFGNATTTVRISRIFISGVQTTAGSADVLLVKRSTANTVGTRVAGAAVPMDAADAAASSIPGVYTANPTTGTLVGAIGRRYLGVSGAAALTGPGIEWRFGENGKEVTLSGTAQGIAINLNGVTLTGGTVNVEIEWYEF